jgi:O-acetyl-ADP-ribose deacetylase (regulator of RNase III)
MGIGIVKGDLLESNEQFICHQCNCVSRTAGGLAYHLFNKFHYANVYLNRQKQIYIPGEIIISGDGVNNRFVINMFAQFNPGSYSHVYSRDSKEQREIYFKNCLEKIKEIKLLKSIAFPCRIGCGIAGGDWDNYFQMIQDFYADISKNKEIIVKIYDNL